MDGTNLKKCKETSFVLQEFLFVGDNLSLTKEEVNKIIEKLKELYLETENHELNLALNNLLSLGYVPLEKNSSFWHRFYIGRGLEIQLNGYFRIG